MWKNREIGFHSVENPQENHKLSYFIKNVNFSRPGGSAAGQPTAAVAPAVRGLQAGAVVAGCGAWRRAAAEPQETIP
jgi:hypothetical protein